MNRPLRLDEDLKIDDQASMRAYLRLDQIDTARVARHIVAYTPAAHEIDRFFEKSRAALGSMTTLAVVRRVISANPDTFHAFALRGRHDVAAPQAEGFIAWLPLTAAGKAALLDGSFDGADPASEHVAGQHEAPAAIYIWGLHAPGRLAIGIGWAYQRWSMPLCRDADIYARAVTPQGRHFVKRIGFERCAEAPEAAASNLFVFRRTPEPETKPLYDTHPSKTAKHTVTVVRSWDALAKIMAIRSAAFIGEQACPYDEEFDGNDFSATHLIGFVDNEPAAAIRVRWFAGFAKAERLAVRPEFRRSRLAFVLVKAAHELCRMKGYTRIYGHAQKRLVDFWARAGGRPIPGTKEFTFSDFAYVEMLSEVAPHPEAINIDAGPYVIIRPEGRWHTAGVLERSTARPVSSPVAGRAR